ncbi:hypothetical protein ABT369_39360 [Dactylosporangium sp. NPDC000244]|uniref:hypothetical protein n=1 Tax=Dactylosporangium sp. NPDC000244 TaxID=3154365 RepID=UPI0033200934
MSANLMPVCVSEFTETLSTAITEDLDGGWMLLPRKLVERFWAAHEAFRAVEHEVSEYIEAHGLELSDDDPPEGP